MKYVVLLLLLLCVLCTATKPDKKTKTVANNKYGLVMKELMVQPDPQARLKQTRERSNAVVERPSLGRRSSQHFDAPKLSKEEQPNKKERKTKESRGLFGLCKKNEKGCKPGEAAKPAKPIKPAKIETHVTVDKKKVELNAKNIVHLKGIFNGESDIESATAKGTLLPLIQDTIEVVRRNIEQVGLFRESSDQQQKIALASQYDDGKSHVESAQDVNVLIGVLKLYLSTRKVSLIPYSSHNMNEMRKIAGAESKEEADDLAKAFLQEVANKSGARGIALSNLFKLLREVASKSSVNKMTTSNLSIAFSPSCVQTSTEAATAMSETNVVKEAFDKMITSEWAYRQ